MDDETEDAIHMVPVPQKHLKLVYQTLARAMAETDRSALSKGDTDVRTTAPTRSGTLHLQNRNGVTWTPANLKKLRDGLRSPAPLKMLDMVAVRPERPVYFEEVCQELSLPENKVRAQMGTLTKAIKREFGVIYDDANWPVIIGWDKDNGLMYYIMSEEIAKAWRDSREQQGQ